MKKIGKSALVTSLALAIVTTCTAAPMAMGFTSGSNYEKIAEDYAQSIETMTESTGNSYEDLTEAYPDTAINNPSAPSQYLSSVTKLGNDYLSNHSGFTSKFLRNFR